MHSLFRRDDRMDADVPADRLLQLMTKHYDGVKPDDDDQGVGLVRPGQLTLRSNFC